MTPIFKDLMLAFSTLLLGFLLGIGLLTCSGCAATQPQATLRTNPCTANPAECYSIQGEYSQLDCSSQPGTHPWYVWVDPQHGFFMGCQQ